MKATLIFFTALFSFLYSLSQTSDRQAVKNPNNLTNPPKENKIAAGNSFSKDVDSVTGNFIIQKYIAAIGGAQRLQNIQSLDFNGSLIMSDMQLTFSERKQAPNLDYITASIDQDTIMRSVFNGRTGYNQQVGQKILLTSKEINERNRDYLGLFNQLFYLDSSKSFILKNIKKAPDNHIDLYQLDIIMPSGKIISEFYDEQSFLLVKIIENDTSRNIISTTAKYFSNYIKVNGVSLPSKIDILKSSRGGKSQWFNVIINSILINLPAEE